ncbi:MAG: hypothetical protein WCP14_04480 [bacterium]
MKLTFTYTLEREFKRVEDTFKRKDFFIKNGYQPRFPDGINFDNFDLSKAKKQVETEFDETAAKKVEKHITDGWNTSQEKVEAFLENLPYKKPKKLNIVLTHYGMGGSYNLPGTIVLNLRNYNDLTQVVVHELVHIVIEQPVVEKYKLSQWEKESLVDYLLNESAELNSCFPWISYQKEPPSSDLLQKVGWEHLEFEKTKHNKPNPLITKFNKEVAEFYGIPEIKVVVYEIRSREEYDEIKGGKTEDWMVGFTIGKTVFILKKDMFETDSCHPASDFEHVLKHEISHIYFRKLTSGGSPVWLNEGVACYIAKQNKPPVKTITVKDLEKYHNKGGRGVYDIGRFMVDKIVEQSGEKGLFEIIMIKDSEERYKLLTNMFVWLK